MTIEECAEKLGKLIKDDEITLRFNEASNAYREDAHLKSLIDEYNADQQALRNAYGDQENNGDIIEKLEKRCNEIMGEITSDQLYIEYSEAQDKMNSLIQKVNSTISFYAFGISPDSGCTHDCSTCAGHCHD